MARDGSAAVAEAQNAIKKKSVVSRSWILLNSNGEETILDADKYEIMHRVQIHARDLRITDPLLSYPSAILGREGAIVLNLEHIKAIITADEVLLRDPYDDNVIPIIEELRRRLPRLNTVKQEHNEGNNNLGGQHDAEGAEEDGNLDSASKLKSAMIMLTARVQKVRDELEQLSDDGDDMADLYLSRKLAGGASPFSGSGAPNWFPASPTIGSKISRASRASAATFHGNENDVEELEMLLEAYFMQIDGTLNKLNTFQAGGFKDPSTQIKPTKIAFRDFAHRVESKRAA